MMFYGLMQIAYCRYQITIELCPCITNCHPN